LDLNNHFDTESFEADPLLNQPNFYCGSEYGDCGNLNDFFKLNFEKFTYCETAVAVPHDVDADLNPVYHFDADQDFI
jgi:hypothetical protein